MIPLNDEQRNNLHAVTHDLMLLAGCSDAQVNGLICDVLGTLYQEVLLATDEETRAAASRADIQIRQSLQLDAHQGAMN